MRWFGLDARCLGRNMTATEYATVPLGSRHMETGLLLRGTHGLVLHRDGGGEWRLDASRKAERYVGRRVCIEGVRDGFDLLAVQRIELLGHEETNRRSGIRKWFAQAMGKR